MWLLEPWYEQHDYIYIYIGIEWQSVNYNVLVNGKYNYNVRTEHFLFQIIMLTNGWYSISVCQHINCRDTFKTISFYNIQSVYIQQPLMIDYSNKNITTNQPRTPSGKCRSMNMADGTNRRYCRFIDTGREGAVRWLVPDVYPSISLPIEPNEFFILCQETDNHSIGNREFVSWLSLDESVTCQFTVRREPFIKLH